VSIHKRGTSYEVRWTAGGRKRSRAFARKSDAEAFELDVKRRGQLGPLAAEVIQSRQTLAEFMEQEWWPHYAIPTLADSTRRRYLELWGTHLFPRLGGYSLRHITAPLIEDTLQQMRHAGVGVESQRKSVMLLSSMLRRAVVRGLIPHNPVQSVDKPRTNSIRLASPLAPATVEAIRAQLGRYDQIALDLLAYHGLRPNEMMTADWRDLGDRILRVNASKTSGGSAR